MMPKRIPLHTLCTHNLALTSSSSRGLPSSAAAALWASIQLAEKLVLVTCQLMFHK